MSFLINLILWGAVIYSIIAIIWNIIAKRLPEKDSYGNDNKAKEFKLPYKHFVLPLVVIVLFLKSTIVIVPGQEVYVVLTPGGVSDDELQPGWHFVSPLNKVFPMDKTVWVYTFSDKVQQGQQKEADAIWAPTKDGIKMGLDLSINWRIDPSEASWIYGNVSEQDGSDSSRYVWIEYNLIRAKANNIVNLTISEYSPIEVYSDKRSEIQRKIFERLKPELYQYKLILDNVELRDVNYFPQYAEAINEKKLAEQRVMTLEQITRQKEEQKKQALIDKDIQITGAQGEAEALKIKGQSISDNPKIIALKWIEKWKGDVPQIMGTSGSGMILDISKYF